MHSGPAVVSTASRCAGFRSWVRNLGCTVGRVCHTPPTAPAHHPQPGVLEPARQWVVVGGAVGDPDGLAELDPGDGPAGQDPDLACQAEPLLEGGADRGG